MPGVALNTSACDGHVVVALRGDRDITGAANAGGGDNAFLRAVAATGAVLVARAKSTRHPVVLGHLPDGSYLSCLGGLAVRVIEASVMVTGADGSRGGLVCRLGASRERLDDA